MKLTSLGIEGAWLAESPVWSDDRGFFREWFKADDVLAVTGFDFSIQQANISQSHHGVIRGIHYSLAPQGQAKWVTCVSGSIRDAIVDIRPSSPTFGKSVCVDLEGLDGRAVLIGAGLGHGFACTAHTSTIAYLLSSPFSPADEFEINPMDSKLGIDWGVDFSEATFSEKDKTSPSLSERLNLNQLPN
ncbi:RfbC dTDP-4-dehydrorhamnose 3,5-epimerase and related enzymes [Candidatus Nanopelagicaceae bacterium]